MRKSILLVLPASLFVGCSQNDSDHINNISRKAIGYLEARAGGPQGQVITGYQAVLGSMGESLLDNRVATRLNWDKLMAETRVEVKLVSSGVVKLTGLVKEETQKQRAMEIAQSTTGVNKVINEVVVVVEPTKVETTKPRETKIPEVKTPEPKTPEANPVEIKTESPQK